MAPVLLTSCFDEDAGTRQSARDPWLPPAIGERVNRARKGDRLVTQVWPKHRSTERSSTERTATERTATEHRSTERPSLEKSRARAHEVRGEIMPRGGPLSRFYRTLIALQSGVRQDPVTILHLGDSHIAADGFSGDLRRKFQQRFGDSGRGMMMPGYPFDYYRARGVTFGREGKWRAANSFTGSPGAYGLTGVRLGARDSGAKLSVTSDQGAFEWAEVAFLTQPKGGAARVSLGGVTQQVVTSGDSGAKRKIKRVHIASKGRRLEITAKGNAPVSILSVSAGNNRPGIRYVNFGIPGATADTPRRWDKALVADDLSHLKPDLIVLGYGTNEGFNDDLDPEAYGARVTELLKRLKGDAPQASFLILGPPDSARHTRKKGGKAPCRALSEKERRDYARLRKAKSRNLARWHPPPKLSAVREALRRVAQIQGASFWDWSKVMSGPCGIHAWAMANPPLAARDHVHLRSAGAKRSANALFDELMRGYEAHVKLAVR